MSYEKWPPLASEPEVREHLLYLVGAGAASPTKSLGRGMTVTWISTGLYEIAWAEKPGTYAGMAAPGFEATTAADLKGYTAVAGNYNATTYKLRVSVTGATDALVDLTSTQKMSLTIRFKETSA